MSVLSAQNFSKYFTEKMNSTEEANKVQAKHFVEHDGLGNQQTRVAKCRTITLIPLNC